MFTHLDSGSIASRTFNDDRFGHGRHLAWVLDGATDLIESPLAGRDSDAEWLADFAQTWLLGFAHAADPEPDLEALLSGLVSDASHAFARVQTRAPADRSEYPSAALLLAGRTPNGFRWLGLGDSTALLKTADGLVSRHNTEPDDAGDTWLRDLIITRRAAGEITEAAPLRTFVIEDLRAARRRLNMPNGYAVLSIVDPPDALINRGAVTAPVGSTVLLATDGLMRLVDVYGQMDDAELFGAVERDGIAAVFETLRRVEDEDATCTTYPRVKQSDDATGLLLRLD